MKPGATIGVAAVSGPVEQAKLDRGIARLREMGYRVVEAANARQRRGFLAGSDEERAEGYRRLLQDAAIDAIFFARGGYGSSRVLRFLDPLDARTHPKIHLGASDLTALFSFLWAQAGLITFYGPMVAAEMGEGEGEDWIRVLQGDTPQSHRFSPADVLATGRGEGTLVGGCLSLLASICGTADAIKGDGAILFWEDVGEEIYRLDRLLTQLERSGTLLGLHGMVIGSVLPGGHKETPKQIQEYLQDRFRGAPFPVAMNLPAGHLPSPRTLPLGVRVRLDLSEAPELDFLEAGVI